jgi:MFS family permease
MSGADAATPRAAVPAWAPLGDRVFRALWLAVLTSNVGTWMQTVGAQWLLVDEPNAATLVALVQTATSLPILLLALPAGVLADALDRRLLLVAVQGFLALTGGLLAALTFAGQMPPALLLILTFVLGCGAALTAPAWQALVPDLVPRAQLPSAAALGSMSVNLARAVGPALAGLLIAEIGVGAVFALNALSFAVFGLALAVWGPRETADAGPEASPERFGPALQAGARYVRNSPVVRRILLRSALFVVPASVLWALLPLVATRRLGLGAGGFGLLLGAVGTGAVAGAVLLPAARARLSTNRLLLAASLVEAAALVVAVGVGSFPVVVAALVPAGMAWLTVLSSINASMQLFLPGWVRARGLAFHQLVLFGGQALGALAWGLVAERAGLTAAFLAAAVLLVVGGATVGVRPLLDTRQLSRDPAVYWPEPELAIEPDPEVGPILVTVTYTVPPERVDRFQAEMRRVGRARRRTGATSWRLYRDGAAPDSFVEAYLVPSWAEHLRQHGGRLTRADQEIEEGANALSTTPPAVAHLFPAEPD